MQTDLSKFNNDWFDKGRSSFVCLIWYCVNWMFITSRWMPVSSLKTIILRLFGAKIGKGVMFKPAVNIKYPWKLEIGDNCWIGENVWIDNLAHVKIGSNVCLSQGAMLLCGNHDYKKDSFDLMVGEIVLEDGVWIGAKSTVCPGVHCGSHSVLSVGSVASKDLEPYYIYNGSPAEKIRERVIS